MTYTIRPTRLANVMLAVEALIFAGEQPGTAAPTREKIAIALTSAKRDLVRVKAKMKKHKKR